MIRTSGARLQEGGKAARGGEGFEMDVSINVRRAPVARSVFSDSMLPYRGCAFSI